MASFVFTWVHDKQVTQILNCAMTIKEWKDLTSGVCLCYVIPSELQPSLPDKTEVDKYDCNYGLSSEWVKLPIHARKNNSHGLFNLPRIIWVKKSWTLVELHHCLFNHYRLLF